jgi:glycosyltransferase involved in cell wall biosynthesis
MNRIIEKRTVLHLIERLAVGGAEKLVARLVVQSARGKYKVIVCCLLDGPLRREIEAGGVRVLALNKSRRSIVFLPLFFWDIAIALIKLIALVRREKIHIIHAHLPDCAILAGIAGKLSGARVVATYHGLGILPSRRNRLDPRNGLRLLFYRLAARLSDRCIAVSEPVSEMLRNVVRADPRRIAVIANGADVAEYEKPVDQRAVLRQLGLSSTDVIVTCVGRLVHNKGHKFLIQSMGDVVRRHPQAILLVVGDGPARAELARLVCDLQLDAHVRILGERSDVRELLAISQVFVLPSFAEGISIALLEAMAAGKPVVATAVPGIEDVVIDQETGLLVPARDAARLAGALCEVLSDPRWAQRMGALGKLRVRSHFSFAAMRRQTEQVYDQLVPSPETMEAPRA